MKLVITVLALLTGALFSTAQAGVWVQYPVSAGGNGHFYALTHKSHMRWLDAEAEVNLTSGGHLLSITSADEQVLVEKLFVVGVTNFIGYWTGLNDRAQEGVFVWTSHEPVTYANWYMPYGEPDNAKGAENVMAIHAVYTPGFWHDYPEVLPDSHRPGFWGIIEMAQTPTNIFPTVLPATNALPVGSAAIFYALADEILPFSGTNYYSTVSQAGAFTYQWQQSP